MTDESTVPFGVHAQGVGKIEVSDDDADASGEGNMEGGGIQHLMHLNACLTRRRPGMSHAHMSLTLEGDLGRGREPGRERVGDRAPTPSLALEFVSQHRPQSGSLKTLPLRQRRSRRP